MNQKTLEMRREFLLKAMTSITDVEVIKAAQREISIINTQLRALKKTGVAA